MTSEALCDASVVVKWFHAERESEVAEARTLLDGHRSGTLRLRLLDLTMYEVANIVVRRLGWPADSAAKLAGALWLIDPEPLAVTARRHLRAVALAVGHGLSVYDGAYWATAEDLGIALVTADGELLAAGAGLSPRAATTELL